jgi:hypothetical protein
VFNASLRPRLRAERNNRNKRPRTRDAQTLRLRALPFPRAVTVTKVWTTAKTGPT